MSGKETMAGFCLAAATAMVALGLGVAPSGAGQNPDDYAYADSYGNLVVYSHAGYKRIVVGKGYLAAEFNAYSAGEEGAKTMKSGHHHHARHHATDCYRPPVLLKGRDYMYGLRDGELPEPAGSCFGR